MKRHVFDLFYALALVLLLGMGAFAATVTSSQSGNWSSTATWGGNPIPAVGDNVIINGGFTVTVDVPYAVCSGVQLGGTLVNTGDGTLSFGSGFLLTVAGLVTVGVGDRKGSITMASGGTLAIEGFLLNVLGTWTPGKGTVEFTASNMLPDYGVTSFNNLTISGGTLSIAGSVTVNGTFALTQGAMVLGAGTLTLDSTVTGGGTFSSSPDGLVIYNQRSDGQSVLAGNYGILSFSDFNKTIASSDTVRIARGFVPGWATGHRATGSTIEFNGAYGGVPAFPYNNLIFTRGWFGQVDNGSITVGGSLTITSGVHFEAGYIIILNGATSTNSGTFSARTLDVGSGAKITNNGTFTVSDGLSGAGTLTQGATGILNIGGAADGVLLDASTPGNRVNYAGKSQTLRPGTYHHLSLSGYGTPALTGVSTVNGDFTLSGTVSTSAATGMTIGGSFTLWFGTSFDAGSFSHSVKGNLSNMGAFNANASTFTLNGARSQTVGGASFNILVVNSAAGVTMLGDATVGNALTLSGGAFSIGAHTLALNGALSVGTGSLVGGAASNLIVGGSGAGLTLPALTLNNLTLNRATGSTLSGDATIDGALTITNGALATGVHTITLGPSGTLSEPAGQPVVGNITTTRNVASTSGTASFGNIGVDVALNGVALGSTVVQRKTGTASTGGGHSSIQRFFDIAPTTNTGLNAGLVFHYDSTEVVGQIPGTLELYRSRDNGTTWNNQGGIVNTALRTITVGGINDLSRWTASDTSNRIGNTATPTASSLSPASKSAGDPGFTLTVNGTEFVNGKSTVRFNGSNRTATYVNSTELTAAITASDLLVPGTFPVTVLNAGGGTSNALTFIVNPGAPATVRVETAAGGTGTVAPAESLAVGASITVYAITRDGLDNFVANVAADLWSLQSITGGIAGSDLVPSGDGKSAVFMAHAVGSATITAISGTLTAIGSGAITVRIVPSVNLRYALYQNFPNPCNPWTQINFDMPFAGQVSLAVYDLLGQKVAELTEGFREAGQHSVTWKPSRQSSGVYFYRLQVGSPSAGAGKSFVAVKKLVLLK